MASLYKRKGLWLIDTSRPKRIRIRVGPAKSSANIVFQHINALERCNKFNIDPSFETIRWLSGIDPKLRDRLLAIGLIKTVDRVTTISELCERFEKTKKHCLYVHTSKNMTKFFGNRLIEEVTKADAKAFRNWLATEAKNGKPLAPATVSRRFKAAREAFGFAVDSNWIESNPLEGVKAGKQNNPDRAFYVKPEIATRLIEELRTPELRLAVALGRWAGFRLPSEAIDLRWTDINWELSLMQFRSRKTKCFEGKELRTCPIFPQLRRYLDEAFDAAEDESIYCCPIIRAKNNPRNFIVKKMLQALKRINVDPWSKLLVNLRASRATEIANEFGPKAESDWIGHGEDVSLRHYLMITDDVVKRAIGKEQIESVNGTVQRIR